MPRFFIHVYNDIDAIDDDGQELADLATARDVAIQGARSLMAHEVLHGRPITLHHRVEIVGESGTVLIVLPFGELITIVA